MPKVLLRKRFPKAISITINKHWENGLGNSISHAVHYVENHFKTAKRILFTLADQPFVDIKHLNKIIETANQPEFIYATKYNDNLGVPALFSKTYFEELKRLKEDIGAKKLLIRHAKNVLPIIPDFENIDIDTVEDYKNLLLLNNSDSKNKR